jgi:hypothetical protein
MIYRTLRNTFPALFIVWVIFIIEIFLFDAGGNYDPDAIVRQRLKIFAAYTVLGLIIGGLSAGIIARKKKKYAYFFENDLKKYSKYFIKNSVLSSLAIFALVSREIINHPLLFENSLLSPGFFLSPFFGFIRDKFSPLYFTVFFALIIAMSIHNLIYNLSVYQGAKRIIGYISAVILSVFLVFNFGYLNAAEKKEGKNIILIGVENLKNHHISDRKIKTYPALSKLKSRSYEFVNCFSPVTDPRASLLSVLTSVHPEKGGFLSGYRSYGLENRTVFAELEGMGYKTAVFSDRKFAFSRFDEKAEYLVKYPTNKERLKARVAGSHFLLPVVYNNRYSIKLFSEILLLPGYRDKSYLKHKISEIISDYSSPFMFLYTISDFGKYLPFPYYRMHAEKGGEQAFMTYLDDEIAYIQKMLERSSASENTVICLFGIPSENDGLQAKNYRMPFLVSSAGFDSDRQVKNDYSALDIIPTALDAAGVDISRSGFEGMSFFDPEFVKQDIILTDVSSLKSNPHLFSKNDEGYVSKNITLERELYPLFPRALIRGDYKLNMNPSETGIKYELFDISKDHGEVNEIYAQNSVLAGKMVKIYEEKMNKEFNFKIVNGFVLK